MRHKLITSVMAVGLSAFAWSAGAAVITNGDFEQTNPEATNKFQGWTQQASDNTDNGSVASIHQPGLGPDGGDNAARLHKYTGGVFFQTVDLGSSWQVELDVAVVGNGRLFQMFLPHEGTGQRINLIIQNQDVQVYDGAAFQTAVSGGIDVSSSDDSLLVNHIKIVGDYSGTEPSYTVSVTDSEGVTRDSQSLTAWQGGAPQQGAVVNSVRFETTGLNDSASPIIDNVAIPEPGAAAMGAGLAGLLLLRNRHNR